MKPARVHRHLEQRQQWLGLESFDALALGILLWFLLTFNRGALPTNAGLLAAAYTVLRVLKRGRPSGFTLAFVRYSLRSRRAVLRAGAPDTVGREHPFPHLPN